jgi:dephospho-CoA kinase
MLQAQRALRRPGMTPAKLAQIRSQQVPDAQKRKRADFVITSGYDTGALAVRVGEIVTAALGHRPRAWPGLWLRRTG